MAALRLLSGKSNGSGRQNAATRWPITILLSNGSVLEPLENKTVIGHHVAALPRPVCQSHKKLTNHSQMYE